MFDIGFYEILLILVVALFVMKPKDLGSALYKLGKIVSSIKAYLALTNSYAQDLRQEAEIEHITQEATATMKKREKDEAS